MESDSGYSLMVFTTHLFIFYYLSFTLLIYYAIPNRFRTAFLALISYVFYGWANPPWALLMFFSTVVDYLCGLAIYKQSGLKPDPDGRLPIIPPSLPRTRGMKWTLGVSMFSNLALLAYFKYADFGVENVNRALMSLGLGSQLELLHVALPVGISFYTFQSMSYAIDVYRGDGRPMASIFDFACFEALYPQLVAGPIIRYSDISEQMRVRTHSWEKFARGVAFFACGMGKKILLANPMGHVADTTFQAAGLHWYDAWYGLIAYAFQIYFDFSGYSDIAVGLGLMIGFVFIKNFDAPYRADSITDFWRRWHLSLSTWLRDYLYIPLGGNRGSSMRTYVNLMTVMLLGGLWHGASWNFVIWGGIHGGMLAFERLQGRNSPYKKLPRAFRVAVTFFIVCLSWVFFRAETLGDSLSFFRSLFGAGSIAPGTDAIAAVMYTPMHQMLFYLCAMIVWTAPQAWDYTRVLNNRRVAVCAALLALSVAVMWTQTENPFLYFQF